MVSTRSYLGTIGCDRGGTITALSSCSNFKVIAKASRATRLKKYMSSPYNELKL